jgi:uncharacterized repeat protein (TIGR03833 family)
MYYETENDRYYKVSNRKSIRVSKEKGKDNIYQINQLTANEIKKLLPEKTKGGKKKLIELIKKDKNLEIKVKKYLQEKNKDINVEKPSSGDIVRIIIKPYDEGVTKLGVVKDVLTRKDVHTRGHKVRLHNGVIGRLLKIIKKK